MAEEDCFLFHTLASSNMDFAEQDKKDVSKVFATLRAKLNAKEKELLELQRAQPCLLAPDSEQIDILSDAISSLHLSTQDGSFIFASTSNNSSSTTSVCSTGVDSIKILPSTTWLPQSIPIKQDEAQNEYRLPMVTHLFSLPVSAYVASSSSRSTLPLFEPKNEPVNRLPMVSQLFSMPINAFTSSSPSNIQAKIEEAKPIETEEKREIVNNNASSSLSSKSIFDTESIYSKEHWLGKSSSSESKVESTPLNLDAYIEQTTDKMRRLHTEYLQALEKLQLPSTPADSSQAIKSMYPQIFDRNKPSVPTKTSTRQYPSN